MTDIGFVRGTIRVSGPFFSANMSAELRKNVEDAIEQLAQKGAAMVRSNLNAGVSVHGPTNPPTAAGVIGTAQHGRPGNPFGAVYMKANIQRGPQSGARGAYKYSPLRRAYIIAAILESGRYRGRHKYQGPGRSNWAPGRQSRRPIHQTQRARARLIPMIRSAFDDLAKGLT